MPPARGGKVLRMLSPTFIMIVVLLIVSGVVAYVGDYLGRVLGKKRISLFGLRPRNTSILIAILTGMFITGVTIAVLFIVANQVQVALVRMDQIVAEISSLESDKDQAVAERNNALVALDVLQKNLEDNRIQLSSMQSDIDELDGIIDSLAEEAKELIDENQDLKSQRDSLQARISTAQSQVADLEGQIDTMNLQIADKTARVDELDRQIVAKNDEIRELTRLLTEEVKLQKDARLGSITIVMDEDELELLSEVYEFVHGIPNHYIDLESGEYILLGNRMLISDDELNRAVDNIKNLQSSEAIVTAYADDHVRGWELIPVRLEVRANRKEFNEGDVIYSREFYAPLQGTNPDRAVIYFFMSLAKDYLVTEHSFEPTTSDEVMQIVIDDLIALADSLSVTGYPAEIRMIAIQDLWRDEFLVYGENFAVEIEKIEE